MPNPTMQELAERPAPDVLTVLPVDTYREAAPYLRRPFDLHAVQFRALEGSAGKRLNCAAYVTARTVIDRLNLVCPHLWQEPRYELVPGGLRCDLTVDGLTRSDVGWSVNTGTAMNLKALYSDAFKRAAVKFGVGVSLYTLPRLVLEVQAGHATAKVIKGETDRYGNPKYRYAITASGMKALRSRYDLWLQGAGRLAFGDVLPHGHVEGSTDPEDEGTAGPEDDAPVLATEGDIKTLKESAKGVLAKDIRVCFVGAGIEAPVKMDKDMFAGVGRAAVADLVKELKNAPRKTT